MTRETTNSPASGAGAEWGGGAVRSVSEAEGPAPEAGDAVLRPKPLAASRCLLGPGIEERSLGCGAQSPACQAALGQSPVLRL